MLGYFENNATLVESSDVGHYNRKRKIIIMILKETFGMLQIM